MGYRYGEHKYGEGLYSRWPDWWHTKTCLHGAWQDVACAPPTWTPLGKPRIAWKPGPEASLARPKGFRAVGT